MGSTHNKGGDMKVGERHVRGVRGNKSEHDHVCIYETVCFQGSETMVRWLRVGKSAFSVGLKTSV